MTAQIFEPADQAERDRIREDVGVNMCVEAGAGTGKTTVLVDRIVHMLASGHAEVQHLAVITFTEKAAAELAGRVRQGLEDARETAGHAERERIERALRGLNQAHMETIHAFASSMLRERPLEAGLDPGFEVLDELPAQLAFEAAYDEWLAAELANDAPPPALFDALNLGLQPGAVRDAARALNGYREMLPLARDRIITQDPRTVLSNLERIATELRPFTSSVMNDDSDGAYVQIPAIINYVESLRPLLGRDDAVKRALCSRPRQDGKKTGNRANWRNARDCDAVKGHIKKFGEIVDGAVGEWRAAATGALVDWLHGFVDRYARVRREGGKADFHDLLVWARDLLRGNDEVRAYFAQRYRHILVDEFQDTDPVQVELIVRLCAEGRVTGDWRQAALRPGSLFVVGDPKQSIYRFRRADIAMYDDVKRNMFGGAPRLITQNFRSVSGVIDWVNATFDSLIRGQPGVQPPYEALVAHPRFTAADAVDVISATPAGPRADDVRRAEGEVLASLIRASVQSGAWRVREGDVTAARPATYGDVVVIIPGRAGLEIYEDAFARAGVPYRHEGGRTFFQRQEVRELIAILRAIDDPGDGVATIAALRSSGFGCSDEDLLIYRAGGGRFDAPRVAPGAEGAVAESLRVLRELAARRHDTPLPELVRGALESARLVEFAMLQPQGEQGAANLLKVIDQARAFGDATGGGLRAFVRWLKVNTDRTSEETDAPISEETDDVVRIITIHASKGLEFPIVAFANMDTERPDRTRVIADRETSRLYVQLGERKKGFISAGFGDAEAGERLHSEAEELRKLYVAATRAKDRLIVPFVETSGRRARTNASLSDVMRGALVNTQNRLDTSDLPAVEGDLPVWLRAPATADDSAAADVAAGRDRWLTERAALIAAANRPLPVQTASALKPEWERESAGGDDVRRGRAADFGSAVHLVLERIELRAAADVDAIARAVAIETGLADREAEIAATAQRALGSAAAGRALASERMLQEAPFTVALPPGAAGGLAEGRIDLMWIEDGAIVIADFKTDGISERETPARAATYRNQALVYAWAARQATGLPVKEVVFIFASPGVEAAFACDEAFMAEADALLRRPPADAEPSPSQR